MKRPILPPDPFSVTDSVKERNTGCIYDGDAQSEQDSLQEKGLVGAGLPRGRPPERFRPGRAGVS